MSSERGDKTHRRGGRRPGATTTREAILEAARRQFAQRGYDRASLRVIAADAGVDQKLILHFFGTKQGLFIAAVGLPLDPGTIPTLLTGDPDTIGQRLARVVVELFERPDYSERLIGVVRAAASEPELARMLREFLTRTLVQPAAALLAEDEAELRVTLAHSQVIGLIWNRYILAIEPLASMSPEALASALAPTFQRYLRGPLR
jgi:AcrR family transcriptional regulator